MDKKNVAPGESRFGSAQIRPWCRSTIERLTKVDRGEEILREFGFKEFRVRHHDTLVRLEIAPSEMDRVLNREVVDRLAERFRELGFKYVTLDLQGYRSGSLNEALPKSSLGIEAVASTD